MPHFLAASDVLVIGWLLAVVATAGPRKTVAVVGDALSNSRGMLAAKELGAKGIIAISRY